MQDKPNRLALYMQATRGVARTRQKWRIDKQIDGQWQTLAFAPTDEKAQLLAWVFRGVVRVVAL